MIVNGIKLLLASPIRDMWGEKKTEHGVSYGLSEAGYDIRIKQSVLFDAGWHNTVPQVEIYGSSAIGQKEIGRFCLASTIEEFDMPPDLVGVVHDKSTWARRGLSVFNTVIEPGWKGFLTLELVFHGQGILHIPAGSGIAQVLFHRTDESATYNGKYQNQPDQPVQARDSE
jgi:dCTP deaminase